MIRILPRKIHFIYWGPRHYQGFGKWHYPGPDYPIHIFTGYLFGIVEIRIMQRPTP